MPIHTRTILLNGTPALRLELFQLQWPCTVTLRSLHFSWVKCVTPRMMFHRTGAVQMPPHVAFSLALPTSGSLEIDIETPPPSTAQRSAQHLHRHSRDSLATAIFNAPTFQWNMFDACDFLGLSSTVVARALFSCNTSLTELRSHQRLLRALETQSIDQGLSPEDVATSSGFPSLKAMERTFSRHCNVSWNAVFVRERKHEDSSHLPRAFFTMHENAQSGVELETL
ncbi:AraC-like DNA-binding protein [Paraburkholderia silvatlantica]|uniref:AraC-like DNA-binding protein n=1 Tax=Paraburkholderia silvatlantica TaxID=321895 RepID=A0A2V4TNV5_9BURK|nr:AraC-like DNA-binding protein [Paraburkholderia silvatlantica]